MGITVLGPLTVNGSAVHSRRDRVVLESLATRPGRPVSPDQLSDALWGDEPPASAPKILQGCVVRLRKLLGPDAVTTSDQGYTLSVGNDELDAQRFTQLVARGRELLSLGEADRAAYLVSDALALWGGEPFADLESWSPAVTETQRLRELRLEAEELWAEAQLRSGRHRQTLAQCRAMVREAPLRERRWTLLAQAHYQAGNQAEALRVLHQLRATLVQQLGIDPGPDAHDLEQAILRQDASLTVADAVGASSTCPWLGLRSYDVADADRYFGREADVAACLDILARTPLLALVGPSGCGKSSLVHAGVAAALRSRGRRVSSIHPGARPVESLSALSSTPADSVVIVDQTEELFTLADDADGRQEFVDALVGLTATHLVVLGLRADHLADLAAYPALSRLVEAGLYLVGGLTPDGLREAIEAPARQAGLVLEPGLVDLLVVEVKEDPGALPLLSHSLVETWKRREGNTLTVEAYRASGGIHGAVAQSAERLYGDVETPQRPLLRDLVLRLVSPGSLGEPVRTRVPRRLIATDAEHEQLIGMLVGARLVTSDEGVLEITHEALARAWPRLQGWLDDDVEGQRTLHHLAAAADAWDTLGRPDSELYRGVRLARALEWQSRTTTTLTATERDFLEAARRVGEAEEADVRERALRQARLIRRQRIVLVGAVGLLALALVAGGVAALQSRRANRNAHIAQRAATTALARGAASRSGTTADIDEALLLGVAGVRLNESPETVSSLMGVLARQPALTWSTPLAGGEPRGIDIAPDGRTAAVMDSLQHVRLIDLESGEELAERQVGPASYEIDWPRRLLFSPDGDVLAASRTVPSRQPVVLLDAATLEPLPQQLGGVPAGRWSVLDLSFSHDSGALAAVLGRATPGPDGEPMTNVVTTWAAGEPDHPTLVRVPDAPDWVAAALSPDGRLLYTGSPTVRVHDLSAGTQRELFDLDVLTNLEVTADGSRLGVTTLEVDSGGLILDADTGRILRRLEMAGEPGTLSFSGDGSRVLLSTWGDREVRVWDTASGDVVATVSPGKADNSTVDLDASGGELVTADIDGAVRRWDLDGQDRYLTRVPLPGLPWELDDGHGACLSLPSADGAFVSYSFDCYSRTPRLLLAEVATASVVGHDAGGRGVNGAGSWHPTRPEYVQVVDGVARVWDGRTGRLLRSRAIPGGGYDASYSADGTELVVSGDTTLRLLDAESLTQLGELDLGQPAWARAGPDGLAFALTGDTAGLGRWMLADLHKGAVLAQGDLRIGVTNGIGMSPDGERASVGGDSGDVVILDLTTGEPVRPPVRAHGGRVWGQAFSADGSRMVSTATDGSVVLWDAETAEVLARTQLPSEALSLATILPDGRVLIAPWWEDPAVYVWDLDTERAIEFACRAAGRDMSREEWGTQFGREPYEPVCPDT